MKILSMEEVDIKKIIILYYIIFFYSLLYTIFFKNGLINIY